MEDSKKIVKIIPLISEIDRKTGMPNSAISFGKSHIPTKAEMRKKALDDILRNIEAREKKR